MKRAVFYGRYSSDRQTEQSIEGQRRVCEEFAKAEQIQIVGEYIDRAISGTSTEHREQFQKMLKDSKNGGWDYVLVTNSTDSPVAAMIVPSASSS